MAKKTTVTITTDRWLVISQRSPQETAHELEGWCEGCAASVKWLTPEQAAALSGLRLRALFRAVESGQFHFNETAEGLLWLCRNSILNSSEKENDHVEAEK